MRPPPAGRTAAERAAECPPPHPPLQLGHCLSVLGLHKLLVALLQRRQHLGRPRRLLRLALNLLFPRRQRLARAAHQRPQRRRIQALLVACAWNWVLLLWRRPW